jgi:hypothetical protein
MPLDSVSGIDLFLCLVWGTTEQVEESSRAVREQADSHSYNR